ncbi:hypothetical protein cypCar_00011343 [Cyprinus carpio]|nr:hypothetical protein cypCar_00011343 [Cyprinus carpio]
MADLLTVYDDEQANSFIDCTVNLSQFLDTAGSELRASVHYGQYSLKKSPFPEQVQKQRYLDEDLHERPYYTADKYDQYNRPNPSHAIRQQFYPEENRHQKPYEDADIRGGHSQGDDYPEREMHTRPYGDQGGRRLCEDYEGKCLGGGQFSGGKINRFNDLRIRPGASEYQKEQMQGRRNVDYEERNPAMNPMSMHGRSFNEEKRGTVRETHGRTWDKANEVPGYPPMFQPRDPRAYSQEATPAKKKKKSRFSDVTAEEIALAHTSYPSGLQEARPYASDHRGFQNMMLQETTRDLPERRCYDEDPRQQEQHFEEYSRAEAPRSTQETRYYEESFGKLPVHFQPTSLQEEVRMYAGRAQQRSLQNDHEPGDEPYDPFHPSSRGDQLHQS